MMAKTTLPNRAGQAEDTLAASRERARRATARANALDQMLRSLLVDCIRIGRGSISCRHCDVQAAKPGDPIPHRSDCVVPQITEALGKLQ